ncbi:MAG TPA: dihydropteroate synthase [Dehalococcoidales bacterium]
MINPGITKAGKTIFKWGERTYVMGIINLSPESFSGDGLNDASSAVAQGLRMAEDGSDILDVGGESTKPGYTPIATDEEVRRVVPVIEKLAAAVSVPISIDSSKYEVVRRSLAAGATIINDQWGLKTEPRLAEMAAQKGLPIVLMSNQRDKGGFDPGIKRDTAFYDNIMAELTNSLRKSIDLALQAGVPAENIIIDPGLGFGKTWQYDLWIIQKLAELKILGRPILIGPSRKSFIKMILGVPPEERLEGTAAAVAIGIAHGADIVRVHDVKEMVRVCRVSDAIVRTNL